MKPWIFIVLISAGFALAGDYPSYSYDKKTGNKYKTTQYGSKIKTYGSNSRTGARWNSTYSGYSETSKGTNASGERWIYNHKNGNYRNYNTGRTCRGKGKRRICNN